MGVRVAVIPLGGEATRLRPLTVETSKAMVRILNRPLLEFTLVNLARQGIEEVLLGVRGYHNYRDVYDYFGEGYWLEREYGVRVRLRYMPRAETRGNAEAVKISLEYYDVKEPVVVVQGDNLFNIDLDAFYAFHRSKRAFMTIALKEEERLEEFGVAAVDESMRVLKFVEKPKRREDAPSKLVNTGLYILSEDFLNFFQGELGERLYREGLMDFGAHVIPSAIAAGLPVYGFVTRGYWFDVGSPERYLAAVQFLLNALRSSDLASEEILPRIFVQGTSPESAALKRELKERIYSGDLKVEGSVLVGRHVKIGKGVYIRNSVIDNYTVIENGAEIEDSAVMDRVLVGSNARIARSIIGRHSAVGPNSVVSDSVLGDDVSLGRGAALIGCRIWPHRQLGDGARLENFVLS
ncbi:MAG: NDP-sugar synthase [Thermoproteus sp.]|nr:NDP-sugar synthase [Thermoproteus sp.]